MTASECACEWEGPPSNPKMVKPCVAHFEWANAARRNAVAAEREACAKIVQKYARDDNPAVTVCDLAAKAIRERSNEH